MTSRFLIPAAAAVLLAACAAPPVRPDLTPAQVASAQAAQVEREQALQADDAWSLVGRIAVSNQGKGGSGRVEWSRTTAPSGVFGNGRKRRAQRLCRPAEGDSRCAPDKRFSDAGISGTDAPARV